MIIPRPGDYGCRKMAAPGGPIIWFLQWIVDPNDEAADAYQHAVVCVGAYRESDGTVAVVEAQPSGAHATRVKVADCLWSTGTVAWTDEQRQREAVVTDALRFAALQTPYSFLDYLAIGLHKYHVKLPGLQRYLATEGHMICSQLVAACYDYAGIKLFPGEWDGYVTPAMLASRILKTPRALGVDVS
jgi:hypothetical protein